MSIVGALLNAVKTWKQSHKVVQQHLSCLHTHFGDRKRMQEAESCYNKGSDRNDPLQIHQKEQHFPGREVQQKDGIQLSSFSVH